jgi:hypothetical protein
MARETLASLRSVITSLEAQLAEARSEINALHVAQRPSRAQAPAPAPAVVALTPYRERLAAAKALAMRMGTSVKL